MKREMSRGHSLEQENLRLRREVDALKKDLEEQQCLPGVDENGATHKTASSESAQASLDSEQQLKILTDNLPKSMLFQVTVDPQGRRRFTYVSAGVQRAHGVTPEQVYADPMVLYGQLHEEDLPRLMESEERQLRAGIAASIEVRFHTPDGETRSALLSANPRLLADGSMLWDGVEIDITERKRAEEALKCQADETRWLMKNMANAFIMWGTLFDEEGKLADIRFDYFNDAYERVSGLKLEEVRGKTVRQVWPTTEQSWYDVYGEVALTGVAKSFEMAHAPTHGIYACTAYRPWDTPDRVCCVFENITERKEAEEALRASQAFLDAVIEHSPHSMYVTDSKGALIRMNQACRDLFCVSNEDLVGKYSLLEDDVLEGQGLMPLVRQVFEQGKTVRFALDYDGSRLQPVRLSKPRRLFLEVTVSPILDAQNRVTHAIVQHLDITKRKRVEATLERTRLLLEAVVEQSPVPIVVVSAPDLVVRYTNRAVAECLGVKNERSYVGLSLDEVQKRQTWRDFLPDGTEVDFMDLPLARAMRGEVTRNLELSVLRKDGTQRWEIVNGAPIYSASGELLAGMIVFPDITERKLAEAALKESEERLALALRGADLGTWDWNVRTGATSFDERWAGMLGYELNEIEPHVGSWERLVHPDDLPRVWQVLDTHLEGKTATYEVEYRMRHKSGSWIWILDKGRVIARDAGGKPLRALGTHLDITERKQAEEERNKLQEQLQQAMKMEAIGRLAGGVAHDFNNLLTTIIGNIELARMHILPSVPASEQLDEIGRAAESAASLTRQLLAFSRRQIIEPRVLNLNELVRSLQKMLVRLIGEDVALQVDLGGDLGSVEIDPGQFEQVLVNLAVNARDSMPNGGRLQIETGNVALDYDYCACHTGIQPGPFVMLAVSDTGHGMTDEVKAHIFEPFFTTKPMGHGTGLGLATIFGVVKQAGGSIEVYSEVDTGTSFKIYLPRVEAAAEELVRDEPESRLPTGNETVLLVEDEDSVRHLAVKILVRLGYNVLNAPNGSEAIALAQKYGERIDLLMTDVVMPGINGRELAEQLLKLHPEMAVLFTSGYTENVVVHHGVLDEELNFIGKPYSLYALARKIRQVLEDKRIPPPK